MENLQDKSPAKETNCNPNPHHEFSRSWEDSDLVLVVENQKLHVHSFILKMASPVFKAMLSGDFKERNQQEISLPGKKAEHFVDFLRQIYPQFECPITLANMEHIYFLSDEYQANTIKTLCLNALQHVEITNDNLPTVIDFAQKMNCDKARQNCCKILNNMTVQEITSSEIFMKLDKESLRQTIVPKAQRLEECLRKIQPQFVGVLDCLSFVWKYIDTNACSIKGKPTPCPVHQAYTWSSVTGSITERIRCQACLKVWKEMVSNSYSTNYSSHIGKAYTVLQYKYSNTGMYFDNNIVDALQEMISILKTE